MRTIYNQLVRWQVLIDFDGDGEFTVPRDDVTPWFINGSWNIGFREAFDLTAGESSLTFRLNNFGELFSPENTDSIYYGLLTPFRKVQVYCWYDGVRYNMYLGWISEIEVSPTSDDQYVQIECAGIKDILEDQNLRIPMLENVRADEAIMEVLSRTQTPPAFKSGEVWLIGLEGYSEIGETTVIPDLTIGYDLEEGIEVFPYIGDNVDTETTAMEMINSIVAGERGRLYYCNDNRIHFWNRQRTQTYITVDEYIDYDYPSGTYLWGDLLANDIQVTVYPRKISDATDDILWQLDEPITVRATETKEIEVRFTDIETSAKVSALSARIDQFVSNRPVSYYLKNDSNKTTVVIDNTLSEVDSVTVTEIIIIGRKITTYNELEIKQEDTVSIVRYGRRERRIDTETLSNEAFAQQIAAYELSKFKEPFGRMMDITLMPRDNRPDWLRRMITMRIGDRVRIKNKATHHVGEYFIIGYQHSLNDGAQNYKVIFRLEPASNQNFWLIGVEGHSEIGENTVLGF